jgi:nucleoside-diphosphate-sugar epimerase
MDFLITGAPGWLGNRFLEVLTRPESAGGQLGRVLERVEVGEITCLVLPGVDAGFIDSLPRKVRLVRGDLRRPETLPAFMETGGEAVLFHLAGLIHPRRLTRELYDINARGTHNLLAAAAAGGPRRLRRLVVLSSNSPFGCNADRDGLFDESAPFRPYLSYGRSKMLLEREVESFRERQELDITVLRPCWFYGPHQPRRQITFFTMIRQGKFPLVGDGGNRRSLSYVDHTCQALLLAALAAEPRHNTFWIADERPYSMLEIIDCIRDVLSEDFGLPVKRSVWKLPGCAGELAYAADRLLQGLGLYQQKLHVLSEMNKTIACSPALAARELGYRPDVTLREGMRRSVAWCLEQGYTI